MRGGLELMAVETTPGAQFEVFNRRQMIRLPGGTSRVDECDQTIEGYRLIKVSLVCDSSAQSLPKEEVQTKCGSNRRLYIAGTTAKTCD
jgi:hypothetical protein